MIDDNEDEDSIDFPVMPTEHLSRDDWEQIRRIALELYKNKVHGGDQLKVAIEAYVIWLLDFKSALENLSARH